MDILDKITDLEIDRALPKIEKGLAEYCWLQEHFRGTDVSKDREFQKKFNGFYRVRRDAQWQKSYYRLMEEAKKSNGISFTEILEHLKLKTDRIEASFASKLMATLDPNLPLIDKVVLKNLCLRLPGYSAKDREQKTNNVYQELLKIYERLASSAKGRSICRKFQQRYPHSGITKVKMLDLVLWQIRTK